MKRQLTITISYDRKIGFFAHVLNGVNTIEVDDKDPKKFLEGLNEELEEQLPGLVE